MAKSLYLTDSYEDGVWTQRHDQVGGNGDDYDDDDKEGLWIPPWLRGDRPNIPKPGRKSVVCPHCRVGLMIATELKEYECPCCYRPVDLEVDTGSKLV